MQLILLQNGKPLHSCIRNYLPMNKDLLIVEYSVLNELIGILKVVEEVLTFPILNWDFLVVKLPRERRIYMTETHQNSCDAFFLQKLFVARRCITSQIDILVDLVGFNFFLRLILLGHVLEENTLDFVYLLFLITVIGIFRLVLHH